MFYVTPILIGFIAGYFSGNFGVGGGFLMQPALRLLLGVTPLVTVATPIPVIIASSLTGAGTYFREGYVDTRMGITLAIPGIFATVIGSFLSTVITGELLLLAVALILMFASIRYIRSARQQVDNGCEVHAPGAGLRLEQSTRLATGEPPRRLSAGERPAIVLGFGFLTGLLTGMLGLGGGYIIIPLLTNIFKCDMKTAFGTSLFVIIMFSLPAALTHAYLGHIDWQLAGLMALGIVPGAYIGSRVAIGLPEEVLRRLFGFFLFTLSIYFAANELIALLGA